MITDSLKSMGISVGKHDDPGVPIGGGFRRTAKPHTVIIPMAKTEGISGYGLPADQLTDEHGNPLVQSDGPDQLFQGDALPAMPYIEQRPTDIPYVCEQPSDADPDPGMPAQQRQAAPRPAPVQVPVLADLLLDIPGVGEFPCVYRYVRYGTGCVILGLLEKKSFLPKKWEPRTEPSPVRIIANSKFYFYTGMLFNDGAGDAAVLVELPEKKEEEQNA